MDSVRFKLILLLLAMSFSAPGTGLENVNRYAAPYMGVLLGSGNLHGVQSTSRNPAFVYQQFSFTFNDSENSSFSKKRLTSSLFMGYGFVITRFFIGGEIFTEYSRKNLKENNIVLAPVMPSGNPSSVLSMESVSPTLKLRNTEFGIDLRPGFLFSPETLLFLKLGLARNTLTVSVDATSNQTNGFPAESFSIPLALTNKKSRIAYRLGGGLEQFISTNLAIRGELVYQFYQSLSISHSGQKEINSRFFGSGIASFNVSEFYRVRDFRFMLGLSYYW